MQTISHDFTLLNQFTFFIYPFLHNVRSSNRPGQIQSLEENWDPWWSRLDGEIGSALDSTYFFLPYIRELIFPETIVFKDKPPGKQYANWVKQIDEWNRKGLGYLCRELSDDAVLRITYKKAALQSINSIEIFAPGKNAGVTEGPGLCARVLWIDAMLFPSGLGFLILKVAPDEESPQLGQLIDLNYYLRIVHPPSLNWTLPDLNINRMANKMTVRDLMDFLIQGMTSDDARIYDLGRFLDHVRSSTPRRFSESEAGQVYGERCHVLSYACLNLKNNNNDAPEGGFECVKDRLVFEFASCIPLGDAVTNPMWIPSSEYVKGLKTEKQFSFWQAWSGMALKESVVFLGTEDINFNRTVLPDNIENDYLPLYLYSLYQKYQLFIFADELMRKGAYVAQYLPEVRALMDRFMDFRNRHWFNEVTRKPLGGELYRKFQQGLESPALYDLVSLQVKDLKQHYEERRQRRIDLLVNLVTFVFLPLGTVIGVFGMTFFAGSWWSFIVSIAAMFIVSLGIWRWWTEEFGPRVK